MVTGKLPSQSAKYAESDSMPWCHHAEAQPPTWARRMERSLQCHYPADWWPPLLPATRVIAPLDKLGSHVNGWPCMFYTLSTRLDYSYVQIFIMESLQYHWLLRNTLVLVEYNSDQEQCIAVLILALHTANDRRCYNVTPSIMAWRKARISPVYLGKS